MHQSALENGKKFLQTYSLKKNIILDVGAQNVNGSLKIYKKELNNLITKYVTILNLLLKAR